MIQIRKADGSVLPVPADAHFVEIVNDFDGTLGLVLLQPQPATVVIVEPGSEDAHRYERMFRRQGVNFARLLINRKVA